MYNILTNYTAVCLWLLYRMTDLYELPGEEQIEKQVMEELLKKTGIWKKLLCTGLFKNKNVWKVIHRKEWLSLQKGTD